MKAVSAWIAYVLVMTLLMLPAYLGIRLSGMNVPLLAILGVGISHHLISALITAAVITRKKTNINYIDPSSWI
jgi:hypothetical protein|tara:strand:+ start:4876 stop:5094 length:219 start_codon:yes stop_codon:yes gene_type:complete